MLMIRVYPLCLSSEHSSVSCELSHPVHPWEIQLRPCQETEFVILPVKPALPLVFPRPVNVGFNPTSCPIQNSRVVLGPTSLPGYNLSPSSDNFPLLITLTTPSFPLPMPLPSCLLHSYHVTLSQEHNSPHGWSFPNGSGCGKEYRQGQGRLLWRK